ESRGSVVDRILLQLRAGAEGFRIERGVEQILRHRADHCQRNLVVREWHASRRLGRRRSAWCRKRCAGVIQLFVSIGSRATNTPSETCRAKSAKVSGTLGGRKDVFCAEGARNIETLALVVNEEKELVLEDWTAQGSTKHIPAQFRLWKRVPGPSSISMKIIGPTVGIEFIVPEKLPNISVVAIGTGLDRGVDNPTHKIAELGGGVVGNQVEFLNGVRSGSVAQQVIRYLIVIHAVEQEIVGLLAIAIDQRPAPITAGVVAVIEAARIGRYRPGRKQGQLDVIARG